LNPGILPSLFFPESPFPRIFLFKFVSKNALTLGKEITAFRSAPEWLSYGIFISVPASK
jgi:hypothetical protein